MVHPISLATSYLQTFVITMDGVHMLRGHATGFFVRTPGAILLLTNWHVVSGLDPANPSQQIRQKPSPHYLKVTVQGNNRHLTELTVPLYDQEMKPRWFVHPDRHDVDLAIIEFPESAATYFKFYDIHAVEDDEDIDEVVGRDVFVVGYPFSREELREGFGAEAPYFLPVWKRGSIASEPALRLADRVVLIDALSRAGMSGAPVLMAKDSHEMQALSSKTSAVMQRIASGEGSALDNICSLDLADTRSVTRKRYRFLGIYSGTIGSTKLAEVALGKCWHADVVREAINRARRGAMECHAPVENPHYRQLLDECAGRIMVRRDADGNVVERVQL